MKQLLKEELQELNELNQQSNNIIYSLGELTLQKEGLVENYKFLVSKQNELGKSLTEKYGDGKINLNTGEVIPTEEKEISSSITS